MDLSSPSQKLLFLSDVHLGGFSSQENKHIEQALIALIDFCQSNNIKIFVLGDLFDYWMEYPDYIPPLCKNIQHRWETYNRELGPTLYITGNHDNWTRGYFREIGFHVEPDTYSLTLNDRSILLLHGDGRIDSEGQAIRPALHRFLRDERFIRLYQAMLPPKAGLTLMKWFSRLNRLINEIASDPESLNKWAESKLKNEDPGVIICGHDHIPRKHSFSGGTYINSGTFYKHRTAAFYNKGNFDLVIWNEESGQLTDYPYF